MDSVPPDHEEMFSFRLIGPSTKGVGARLGRLVARNIQIETPSFLAPSSRGVVPHLSHDCLREHTAIRGVYFALEDFIECGIPQSPICTHPGPLRAFTSHPSNSLLFLAPRRSPPIPAPATNTDYSIAVLTSVGFLDLKVNDYIDSLLHLRPDAVVGMADIPPRRAGKNRIPKMVYRTELWLNALLPKAAEARVPVLAPVLPVEKEQQHLYLQALEEAAGEIAGLAFYDSSMVPEVPETLAGMVRVALDEVKNPHKLLQAVGMGLDVFTLVLPTEATDAGIALAFEFPGEMGKKRELGWDMWNEPEMVTDTRPLVEGCACYACIRHHRAYVCHLLTAKEMTAWVLLQIHNMHVMERFFAKVRESIAKGAFEGDVKRFAEAYEEELPAKTGQGPRLRGYQFKTTAGPRKNPKAYGKLTGDKLRSFREADTPPSVDAGEVDKSRLVERL